MKIIHRTKADYEIMPWKNGGGVTTELAIYPPGMTVTDPFIWRLSKAQIESTGGFSKFPGYERHILQLDGGKVTLDHGEHGTIDLSQQDPYIFSGDWSTAGILHSGRVQDLNLILLSSHCQGGMQVYHLKAKENLYLKAVADFTVLHLVSGSVVTATPDPIQLLENDSLIVDTQSEEIKQLGGMTSRRQIVINALEVSKLVLVQIKMKKN